jgi:hypothetical protein
MTDQLSRDCAVREVISRHAKSAIEAKAMPTASQIQARVHASAKEPDEPSPRNPKVDTWSKEEKE